MRRTIACPGPPSYARCMSLEDSIGDILRKARISTATSTAAAAKAAGLSEADYEAMESTGKAPAGTRFGPLGDLLTIGGARVEAQSHGWLPAPVDLTAWQALEMITTAGDGMTVNAYLAWDPDTKKAVLFDTGFEAGPILSLIQDHALHLEHILITHSHADHVAALGDLRKAFPNARVHSGSRQAPADQQLKSGSTFEVGSLHIRHQPTPGHAEDGITFVITGWADGAPPVAIVGDAIFAGSMGGARDQLKLARARVQDVILSLPAPTLICSGHGPITTVGEEKAHNPWFP